MKRIFYLFIISLFFFSNAYAKDNINSTKINDNYHEKAEKRAEKKNAYLNKYKNKKNKYIETRNKKEIEKKQNSLKAKKYNLVKNK